MLRSGELIRQAGGLWKETVFFFFFFFLACLCLQQTETPEILLKLVWYFSRNLGILQ